MSETDNAVENGRPIPVVIVVDDDELVTTTLGSYLQLETDYEVHTFLSPFAAIEYLKTTTPDVVISDFLMPKMDGLLFLSEVKKLHPEATTMLLTGYADKENAIKAINEVGIFQYLEKPWENDHLKLMIRNGISQAKLRSILREKIRELDSVLMEKDELAQHNDMLQHELSLARNVQMSMLPQKWPEAHSIRLFAKYEPALEVGGDFYDVIRLADDKLCVLVADVTGHGIQAALMTVLLKSSFGRFANTLATPGDILVYMNKTLNRILPKGHFVAGIVVTVDLENSTCVIVNAGIPHPYHLRRQSRKVERIHSNGLILGVAPEDVFKPGEEASVNLERGDRLILLTDGLTEAENGDDQLFESEALLSTLGSALDKSSDELLDILTQAAQDFSKPGHKWDDITILGIENRLNWA